MEVLDYMLGKKAGGGSITETDPVFSNSPASGITNDDISNWNGKQNALTFDSTPTQNSTNPVTSNGIFEALQNAGGGGDFINLTNTTYASDLTENGFYNLKKGNSFYYTSTYRITASSTDVHILLIKGSTTNSMVIIGMGMSGNIMGNNINYTSSSGIIYIQASNSRVSNHNFKDFSEVYVKTTGNINETITGVKTFNSLPICSVSATYDTQLTNKKYVDALPTTYSGYDASKTQVLKNINGTLTWVDEQ